MYCSMPACLHDRRTFLIRERTGAAADFATSMQITFAHVNLGSLNAFLVKSTDWLIVGHSIVSDATGRDIVTMVSVQYFEPLRFLSSRTHPCFAPPEPFSCGKEVIGDYLLLGIVDFEV